MAKRKVQGEEETLLMPSAAARLLCVSPRTLTRMADNGQVRVVVLPSGHRRYPESDIRRIRAGHAVAA